MMDFLSEGYYYVFTSRFQSDPIERHFSKYRLLLSLREVNNSEKILALSSIIKQSINSWEEDIYTKDS